MNQIAKVSVQANAVMCGARWQPMCQTQHASKCDAVSVLLAKPTHMLLQPFSDLQALPSQATIVSPAALLRHVSSTRAIKEGAASGEEEPWNQDHLQALLAAIYKVTNLDSGQHSACLLCMITIRHVFDAWHSALATRAASPRRR